MSASVSQPEPPDIAARRAADAEAHLHALNDLIGMGTGIARFLHRQASAQDAQAIAQASNPDAVSPQAQPAPYPNPLAATARAFDGIARTVRRCIMLVRSLDAPAKPLADPARHRAAARARILRQVEDAIGRDAPGHDAAEALRAELHERLDAPDLAESLDKDLADRPVADLVTDILRDLGLAAQPGTRPWKRRTPADLRQLHARAAAPPGAMPPSAPQPGPSRPGPAPQGADPSAARPPGPPPTPRAHPGNRPPDGPAATVATLSRQLAIARGQWGPPPGD